MSLETFLLGKPKKPDELPAPPRRGDQKVQEAARKERARIGAAAGHASTIRTSPQGVRDSNVGTKRALGE